MNHSYDTTTVVIIGASVAGLSLGNMLQRNNIDCILVERRTREHVESRQRAGTIDTRGVRMFREWGLEGVLGGSPIAESEGGFWIDGNELPIEFGEDGDESLYCPQQILLRNLADTFLGNGGDIRYEAIGVSVDSTPGSVGRVTYADAAEDTHIIEAEFIAGCDGDRGASRASIPDGILTRYSHEFPYAWLSVQAQSPTHPSGMAIHSRGLAGIIPRGQDISRIYLQVPREDELTQWPDERIWEELESRFGTPPAVGLVQHKQLITLRCVVFDPMNYGSLYLLGDAAHIVPPMSAKGINLALHDAEIFARALIRYKADNDSSALNTYSEDCLQHVWNYQAFAVWITNTMHDAGDPTYRGEFHKQIARAELQRQFASAAANQLFSELTAGTN